MRHNVDYSSKPRRREAREFWEAAIRLWRDSGLSVREFCRREGLAEHTFYSWRRELLSDSPASEIGKAASATSDGELTSDGRRRRQRKQVAADDMPETATSFIELAPPASAGLCCCTLELENTSGAKMRIELTSAAVPDLAAISRSFWNPAS